jgi:hypothetical protein
LSAVARTLGYAAGSLAAITHVAGNDEPVGDPKKRKSSGTSPSVRKRRPNRVQKSDRVRQRARSGGSAAPASSGRTTANKRSAGKTKKKARKR